MKYLIKDLEILKEVKNDDILAERLINKTIETLEEMQEENRELKKKLAETTVEVFALKMEYDEKFRSKYVGGIIEELTRNLTAELSENIIKEIGGLK